MNTLFTTKFCNILTSNVTILLVLVLYQVLSSSGATWSQLRGYLSELDIFNQPIGNLGTCHWGRQVPTSLSLSIHSRGSPSKGGKSLQGPFNSHNAHFEITSSDFNQLEIEQLWEEYLADCILESDVRFQPTIDRRQNVILRKFWSG